MAKPKRGHPTRRPMPEPIPDPPEYIIRAMIATPPKRPDEWRYLQGDADDPGGSLLHR